MAQNGQNYDNKDDYKYQMLESRIKYEQEPYRFVIIGTYFLACLVNAIPAHAFSSINVAVQQIFNINSTAVTMNTLIFIISHPVFAYPCNWIINKYGMRISFVFGAVLLISGVWLRLLIQKQNPTWCLVGSVFASIGNIFVVNTPSKIAINWFRSDRVNLMAFLGILVSLISVTAGAALPGFFINENDSTVKDVHNLLFLEAIIVTAGYIPLVIFFRNQPKYPPSKSARALIQTKESPYKDTVKSLFKNKQYLKLMVVISLSYGTLTAVMSTVDQAIKGFGYVNSSQVTSTTILSAMFTGVLGTFIFSIALKKTNAYKLITSIIIIGSLINMIFITLVLSYAVQSQVYISIVGALLGFFLIPLPSVIIMYGSQIVFPIDQSSSAGYLLAAAQTFGFVLGLVGVSVLNKTKQRSQIVFFSYSAFYLISLIISFFVKEDLRKLKFSQGASQRQKSHLSDSLIVKDMEK